MRAWLMDSRAQWARGSERSQARRAGRRPPYVDHPPRAKYRHAELPAWEARTPP